MNEVVLACHALCKSYKQGEHMLNILQGVDFELHAGEQVAIVGPSGGGKSTLLHILAGLAQPSDGTVHCLGQDLYRCSERLRCQIRNQHLGFVYQFHHLLPEFNTLENVAMPLLIRGTARKQALARAAKLLQDLGLGGRQQQQVQTLSGGERQRVAIARALVGEPRYILADEPTGNLDMQTAQEVTRALLGLNQFGTALLMVTHDNALASQLDRMLRLDAGRLTSVAEDKMTGGDIVP